MNYGFDQECMQFSPYSEISYAGHRMLWHAARRFGNEERSMLNGLIDVS
jgi:hypothetical protein